MSVFGMGPLEIVLIVVLALIVFGPARLPEIMGQVGKAIADFRRATSELSDEFNKTIQAELKETRAVVDDAKSAVTGLQSTVTDVHASVTSAVTGTPAPVRAAVPGVLPPTTLPALETTETLETVETLPAANGTSGEPHLDTGTNGTAAAAVTSPLAEAVPWSWDTSTSPPATPAPTPSTETTSAPAARDELIPPY